MKPSPITITEVAKRLAEFVNEFDPRVPLRPEDVNLRHIAQLCYVIDVNPDIRITKK